MFNCLNPSIPMRLVVFDFTTQSRTPKVLGSAQSKPEMLFLPNSHCLLEFRIEF